MSAVLFLLMLIAVVAVGVWLGWRDAAARKSLRRFQ